MTAITDKKLRDKLMKEKTLELKKNDRINQTEHLWEKEQEKHKTRSTNFNERKTCDKRRTDTKNGKIRNTTKNYTDGN